MPRLRPRLWRPAVALLISLAGCGEPVEQWSWDLPPGFPVPPVPDDNPMTAAKVELGRRLFYDRRLSAAGNTACASCHSQALAFTDGAATATGSTGAATPRSAMSLANVGYARTLTWGNPLLVELEQQSLVPLFGEDPVEIGAGATPGLLERLAADPYYVAQFPRAFPDASQPMSLQSITRALAAFERTLISGSSPYDAFVQGDVNAISPAARRGAALFDSVGCATCHGGFALTDAVFDPVFHNIGLPPQSYLPPNRGVREVSGNAQDEGYFKAPTLRNIAMTAPYMHDGSLPTLGAVLDHFSSGGVGDGMQAAPLPPFALSDDERNALLAFLGTLTDTAFLRSPTLADPWLDD